MLIEQSLIDLASVVNDLEVAKAVLLFAPEFHLVLIDVLKVVLQDLRVAINQVLLKEVLRSGKWIESTDLIVGSDSCPVPVKVHH